MLYSISLLGAAGKGKQFMLMSTPKVCLVGSLLYLSLPTPFINCFQEEPFPPSEAKHPLAHSLVSLVLCMCTYVNRFSVPWPRSSDQV